MLNKKVKKLIADIERSETKWNALLDTAFLQEDIMDNRNNKEHVIKSTFWVPREGKIG